MAISKQVEVPSPDIDIEPVHLQVYCADIEASITEVDQVIDVPRDSVRDVGEIGADQQLEDLTFAASETGLKIRDSVREFAITYVL